MRRRRQASRAAAVLLLWLLLRLLAAAAAAAAAAVAAAAAAVLAVQPTCSIQPLPLMLHRRPLANLREPPEASTPRPPAAERETLPLWKASEERVPQRGDAR